MPPRSESQMSHMPQMSTKETTRPEETPPKWRQRMMERVDFLLDALGSNDSLAFVRLKQEERRLKDPTELPALIREAAPHLTREEYQESGRMLVRALRRIEPSERSVRLLLAQELLRYPAYRSTAILELHEMSDSDSTDTEIHECFADSLIADASEAGADLTPETAAHFAWKMKQAFEEYEKIKSVFLEQKMGYRRGLTGEIRKKIEDLEAKQARAAALRHRYESYLKESKNYLDFESSGDRCMENRNGIESKTLFIAKLNEGIAFYQKAEQKAGRASTNMNMQASERRGARTGLSRIEQKISEALQYRAEVERSVAYRIERGDRAQASAEMYLRESEKEKALERIHDAIAKYQEARSSPGFDEIPTREMQKYISLIDKKIAAAEAAKKQTEERLDSRSR